MPAHRSWTASSWPSGTWTGAPCRPSWTDRPESVSDPATRRHRRSLPGSPHGRDRSGSRGMGRITVGPGADACPWRWTGWPRRRSATRAWACVRCCPPDPWRADRSGAVASARPRRHAARAGRAPAHRGRRGGARRARVPRAGWSACRTCVVQQRFEGDDFELEDQRNWTDDSFKAYSLMAGEAYPRMARAGQSFRQRITPDRRATRRGTTPGRAGTCRSGSRVAATPASDPVVVRLGRGAPALARHRAGRHDR